jgi:excisionase family DNA binding protein
MTKRPHNKGARMPERFYTAEDLADYIKVSPQTVRAWIRDGKLKAVKFGRSWRIADDEVQRIVAEGVPEDEEANNG